MPDAGQLVWSGMGARAIVSLAGQSQHEYVGRSHLRFHRHAFAAPRDDHRPGIDDVLRRVVAGRPSKRDVGDRGLAVVVQEHQHRVITGLQVSGLERRASDGDRQRHARPLEQAAVEPFDRGVGLDRYAALT